MSKYLSRSVGIASLLDPVVRPPTLEQIGAAHLLADAAPALAYDSTSPAPPQSEAQGVVDYTQTLIEGEELMFTMDVPYVPAQDTPIVLAQAATSGAGATPQPDYILKDCQETQSTGDPNSAIRGIDPGYALANALNHRAGKKVVSDLVSIRKNVTLLEGTKHGKLVEHTAPSGALYYRYDPEPEYEGDDQAVFMAEFEGKRYKIVVKLVVSIVVDFNAPQCSEPQLIKVKKPSTSSSGYDLNSISVTFGALDGGAVGLTDASGITLDDNAAGHNWYIDATPWDNSEYLPTSKPYEWVAKALSRRTGRSCLTIGEWLADERHW